MTTKKSRTSNRQTTSVPVHEETGTSIPPLSDAQALARYLLELFGEDEVGATGALLLDEQDAPLGLLLLELRSHTDRSGWPAALSRVAAQIVPFLYCPPTEPIPTDEQIEAFAVLSVDADARSYVRDTLTFWHTGQYMARSNKGRLKRLGTQGGGE